MYPSSILFVCLGNICRSPLAEGVFRNELKASSLAGLIAVDSAATGGWHVGNCPDRRSIEVAERHGIDITRQTCRRLTPDDFENFDLVLCMDQENITNCKTIGQNSKPDIALMMDWAGLGIIEIPDPYYGSGDGFEKAYQMIRTASRAIINRINGTN